ncbi:tumor necrosis factor receptor superfamily member 4 isoform X2 [Rhinatrema bivittatum]|uniref:tumor necrosis factor receptor superfamily member 4 isoform X2 n=1 Tax=Rhinatrema bivittatum TaxID=194408 RepID=UPI0011277A03|nr:tumor necrosis factor receptor superfamily member 4 isoform X2 [Rhinatrema bivittatum]
MENPHSTLPLMRHSPRRKTGWEMVKRCQWKEETECKQCPSGYFSEKYTYDSCTKCLICDENSGSMEVKRCEKTSNAICQCANGTEPYNKDRTACRCPKGHQLLNKKSCSPCPEGTFSSKENSRCQPWTNCTALGGETETPGSRTTNTVCNLKVSTTLTASTSRPTTLGPSSARSAMPGVQSISHSTIQSLTSAVPNYSGSFSLFIIGLILLGISGLAILLMLLQSCKQTTKGSILLGLQGRKSFRRPVQEEHTTSACSLTKV